MKKFKKIAYIVLIAIVVILSLTIYTNASKNNGENQKEKVLSEIKFIETKLINIFNNMNNIKTSDYNIVTTEISTESNAKSESEGEQSSQGGEQSSGGMQEESSKSQGGASSGGASSDSKSGGESKKSQEVFEIKPNEILTNEEKEINWENIKNEIENLYNNLPSFTMDLYQFNNINQQDILNFNKEYDNLTTIIKDEDKGGTLEQLTKVYDYLPIFLRGSEQEELYTTTVETKSHIFKAYSKLENENWSEMSNDIKNAIDVYSKLLTNTTIPKQKQSNISKGYVMLNEIQNAINLQDKEVFLIKYKNLLEEINDM